MMTNVLEGFSSEGRDGIGEGSEDGSLHVQDQNKRPVGLPILPEFTKFGSIDMPNWLLVLEDSLITNDPFLPKVLRSCRDENSQLDAAKFLTVLKQTFSPYSFRVRQRAKRLACNFLVDKITIERKKRPLTDFEIDVFNVARKHLVDYAVNDLENPDKVLQMDPRLKSIWIYNIAKSLEILSESLLNPDSTMLVDSVIYADLFKAITRQLDPEEHDDNNGIDQLRMTYAMSICTWILSNPKTFSRVQPHLDIYERDGELVTVWSKAIIRYILRDPDPRLTTGPQIPYNILNILNNIIIYMQNRGMPNPFVGIFYEAQGAVSLLQEVPYDKRIGDMQLFSQYTEELNAAGVPGSEEFWAEVFGLQLATAES